MIYNGKLIKMTEYIRNTLVFLFVSSLEVEFEIDLAW